MSKCFWAGKDTFQGNIWLERRKPWDIKWAQGETTSALAKGSRETLAALEIHMVIQVHSVDGMDSCSDFQDRNQPEVTDKYFHDVPFDAHFASELSEFHSVSSMPGVDGFTLKVDALYKVCSKWCP